MRKLLLLFFAMAAITAAQTPTVVSGTITDTSGIPYSYAKVSATLVGIPPNVTATIIVNGVPTQIGGQVNATADVNGVFSTNLFCNTSGGGCSVISPSGTQWQFTINETGAPPPIGTGPQVCSGTFTITGASQSLTSSFAGCPALSHSSSAAGSAAVSAPVTAVVYLNPNCPVSSTTPPCIYTPANTVIEQTCNWTTTSNVINCTGANFTSTANTTQIAFGLANCDPDQVTPVGGSITATHVTVTGVTDATHLTISANPANLVAANGCFVHGTPDDTGAAAVDAALNSAISCPKIELAAGGYMFTTFHFLGNPTACQNLGTQVTATLTQGNIILANGEELEGRGPGPTVWYLPPDFPQTGTCSNGINTDACWAMPLLAYWHHFSIAGSFNTSMPAGKVLLAMNLGQLDYFSCYDVGMNQLNSTGLEINYWAQGNNVNFSSCGQRNVAQSANAFGMFMRLDAENGNCSGGTLACNLNVAGWMTCIHCEFLGTANNTTTPIDIVVGTGGTLVCDSCFIGGAPVAGFGTGSSFPIGIRINGNSGSTNIFLRDTNVTNSAPNSQWISIQNNVTSGAGPVNLFLDGNIALNHGASGASLSDNTGIGPFTAYIGSTVRPTTGANTGLDPTGFAIANIEASGRMVQGTCTGTVNSSVTNSLYGTGPNVTATTCAGQTSTIGTGFPVQYPTTLSTLACTSTATTVSVACKVMVNGAASTITCTMTATTSCFDFAHTVSLNKGDLVSLEIVTGAAETGANIKASVMWNP